MRRLRWVLIQSDWCPYKKRKLRHTEKYQGHTCTEERPCEEVCEKAAGGQLPASQGERPQETPNLLTPGLLASRTVRK